MIQKVNQYSEVNNIFILIEIDRDWTFGIDWYKHSKGFRLGFIAIHLVKAKHTEFIEKLSEAYHRKKVKEIK